METKTPHYSCASQCGASLELLCSQQHVAGQDDSLSPLEGGGGVLLQERGLGLRGGECGELFIQ